MWLRIVFIAAVVLIGLSCADVSEITAQKDDLLVPFNDLLPPLLEESPATTTVEAAAAAVSGTTTTTTVKPQTTTLITKPTKKSYYQQKQTQLNKEEKLKSVTNKQNIQLLSLDLLPPFEESPETKPEDTPVAIPLGSQTAATRQQHVARVQPTIVAKVQPQAHVAKPQFARLASVHVPPPSVAIQQQRRPSSPIFSSQFSNYFQTSTPRPRRGPLPTLTPFPHHIKK